ncbi:MAG: site-2 protease family protein [Anaerolineae bacterium]|nr:site-2 protease family protein [Thermoflexales bacterium]MDW8408089.1 site-2 protease family protein [Anaerolineae bacterium]
MSVEDQRLEDGRAVTFIGKLRVEAEEAFSRLKARFLELGYVPLLREHEKGERQIVVAVRGKMQSALVQRPWIHLALLMATAITTVFAGGRYAGMLAGDPDPSLEKSVGYGVPFAAALLLILGAHELGHYIQARRHRLPVTLPYFIPVPFGLGTFGAFVQMRGPVENRRALFDVGVGGPIAGLLVAVPLFIAGLVMSVVTDQPAPPTRSMLMDLLIALFLPDATTNGILLNPVLLAARFGLVITAINLLPVGQLDGSHIAYAALGRRWARWIGNLAVVILFVLGLISSPIWLVWMGFALLSGVHHAAPMNDITPLDLRRTMAFLATAVLFLSLFSATPF